MLNNCWRQQIKKIFPHNITFVFSILSENMITFVRMWLFPKTKNIVNLRKSFFKNKAACACATVQKYFTQQISIMEFNTFIQCLKMPLTQKWNCSKVYFLILNYLKKNVFCNIRYEKCKQSAVFFFKIVRKIEWPTLVSLSP